MNWLLPVILLFLLLCAWDGHRKGLIRKSVGILSLALTLVLTAVLTPMVAAVLKVESILAFLIVMILVGVLVRGIAFSLDLVSGLPIIHGLNKTAGMLFGVAEGLVAVWVFFFAVTVLSFTETGGMLLRMTQQSAILSWLYRNNLLNLLLK